MKVLHVASGHVYGGIERFLSTIAHYKNPDDNVRLEFAFCHEGKVVEEIKNLDRTVHELGPIRTRRIWEVLRARFKFSKILTREQYDVCLFHGPWCAALLGWNFIHLKTKLVLWIHGIPGNTLHDWISFRLDWHGILVNSRYIQHAVRSKFPTLPVEVCECALDLRAFEAETSERTQLRQNLNVSEDTVVILWVGRMEEWKGQRILIQALGLLQSKTNWECWIVGAPQSKSEAKYYDSLRKECDELKLAPRFRFFGWQQNPARFYIAADLFCQPNIKPEPFGLVFVEAMASGLPVVATDSGGASEILDSSCARLLTRSNPESVTAALKALIEDANLRHRLGNAGKTRALDRWNMDHQMPRIHETLRRIAICANDL